MCGCMYQCVTCSRWPSALPLCGVAPAGSRALCCCKSNQQDVLDKVSAMFWTLLALHVAEKTDISFGSPYSYTQEQVYLPHTILRHKHTYRKSSKTCYSIFGASMGWAIIKMVKGEYYMYYILYLFKYSEQVCRLNVVFPFLDSGIFSPQMALSVWGYQKCEKIFI